MSDDLKDYQIKDAYTEDSAKTLNLNSRPFRIWLYLIIGFLLLVFLLFFIMEVPYSFTAEASLQSQLLPVDENRSLLFLKLNREITTLQSFKTITLSFPGLRFSCTANVKRMENQDTIEVEVQLKDIKALPESLTSKTIIIVSFEMGKRSFYSWLFGS